MQIESIDSVFPEKRCFYGSKYIQTLTLKKWSYDIVVLGRHGLFFSFISQPMFSSAECDFKLKFVPFIRPIFQKQSTAIGAASVILPDLTQKRRESELENQDQSSEPDHICEESSSSGSASASWKQSSDTIQKVNFFGVALVLVHGWTMSKSSPVAGMGSGLFSANRSGSGFRFKCWSRLYFVVLCLVWDRV